ncbi:MAG: Fic family protein [Candidatus Margulisbacteria bacterium]|nr:Fic family protein [Candidatus Margulisiibacteriota bacterium]
MKINPEEPYNNLPLLPPKAVIETPNVFRAAISANKALAELKGLGEKIIRDKLKNLEIYIHEESEIDPLIKLAIIHHQFEAIHPFYDGNGRTGRILNVLYLTHQKLLRDMYINKYKAAGKIGKEKILENMKKLNTSAQINSEEFFENRIIFILIKGGNANVLAKATYLKRDMHKVGPFTTTLQRNEGIYSQDSVDVHLRLTEKRSKFLLRKKGKKEAKKKGVTYSEANHSPSEKIISPGFLSHNEIKDLPPLKGRWTYNKELK